MNKKFLSAVLFGALMVTSTGTFVSCKDYDDDIDQINKELTDIKSAIADLQSKVDNGKYVTNVVKEGDGIKITWNDGNTSTIETIKGADGADGKNGTIVTIVDGYWAFDGVKSEYPAKGDKGDKGEDGAAAAAGHDAKISPDGYWMVWDAEAGEYKQTEYIAGGATAVAGEHGWTIIVRDKNGQEQSIYIPNSADLVSIETAKGETGFSYNIYYGILKDAKDWEGAKAVNGKMEAGMYPTLDRDVNVLLNPISVDATAYKFDFRASDNAELWGLTFGDMVPYSGEKLTRAVSSDNGLWTLPRTIQRVTLENYQDRPDYVTQFKKNDSQYYAFAMNAVSKDDASKVVKSQYLYKFMPYNVNSVKELDGYFKKVNYTWNTAHKPNFAASWNGNTTVTGQTISADSALIYDYWLEIDKDEMSQVKIDKYGLEIVNNKYEFIAKNAAAVDNQINLKFHYILINGNEGMKKITATIIEKDIETQSSNIGSINEKFNAELLELTGKEALPVDLINGKYVYAAEVLSFDLAEKLGANKDQWIDAMYNGLKNRSNVGKSTFLKEAAALTGGDPINNGAAYNQGLLSNFIFFDYVDKDGKSCIYNAQGENDEKLLSRLESIAGLKVYFIAGTYKQGRIVNNAPVHAPYYTEDGTANWNTWDNGYALPLNNAFRVQLFTNKEQQAVAALDFSFELTMPDNCPIKRETVGNQTSVWNDKQNALTIYGQKYNDQVNVDMRDAFVGAFALKSTPEKTEEYNYAHAYGEMKPEAEWYKITWAPVDIADNAVFININLASRMIHLTSLGEIANTAEYGKWNTFGYIASVFEMNGLKASENRPTYATEAVEYDHFGVYPESLSNFTVKFASKVEDSQKAGLNPELKLKEAETIEAKAVYEADGIHVDYYTFSVSNASFTMTDAFNNAYYLFDNATAKRGTLHVKLNEATQGIVRDDANIATNYFGLYPVVRVDESIAFTSLPGETATSGATPVTVEFIQDKTSKNYTGMTFKIPGGEGKYANDKKFDITFNVTDVFGTVKSFTFYARTVNEAIGNDNKPVGE